MSKISKMWNFLKTPEFWVAVVLVPLTIALVANYFSSKPKNTQTPSNKGGDIIIRAGDGSVQGNGGNVYIGPGTYKAGDAIQSNTNKSQ
ncbi:MAG TPA: hypothetical protein VMH91_01765 [Candidatus Paceibacterota bacterium]|nr:hypothetical protein [Candidatus Paceibacterota bacterium]